MFIRKIKASMALRPKFRSKAAIFSSRLLQLSILIYWAIILFLALTDLHVLTAEFAPKTSSGIESIEPISWRQAVYNLVFVPIAQLMPFVIFYLKSHPSTNLELYYDMSQEADLAWIARRADDHRRIDDERRKIDKDADNPEASICPEEGWNLLDDKELSRHLSMFADDHSSDDELSNNDREYSQLAYNSGLELYNTEHRSLEIFPSFVENLRKSETLFCYLTIFSIDVTVVATLLLWGRIHLLKGESNWSGAGMTEFLVTANVVFLLLALLVLFFNAWKSQSLFTSRNRES
jgi:hypothetical protein